MAPQEKKQRKVVTDIQGNVIESEFVNGETVYSTDTLTLETLSVVTPPYTNAENINVEQKTTELFKLTKWKKEFQEGGNILLTRDSTFMMGKFAFWNMVDAMARQRA